MSKDNQPKPPIFIVGAPRSGTTLLTSFLVSHPNIVSGPETQFFNKIGLETKELKDALKSRHWPRKAVSLMKKRLFLSNQSVLDLYGKDENTLSDYLEGYQPSLRVMLEALTTPSQISDKGKRWLEKTPNHLNYLSEIRKNFPHAKIILIHRDLRDSACSIPKLPWASNSILDNAALVGQWFTNSNYGDENGVLFVSYEKLVSDCENQLKLVFDFLDEEFDNTIIERRGAHEVTTKGEPWKQDVHQAITLTNIGKWREQLDLQLIRQLEAITGHVLETLGYKKMFSDTFSPLHLKKLRGQKLDYLDAYAELFNHHQMALSYIESDDVLIYVDKGMRLNVLLASLKSKFKQGKRIYFIGKKSITLSMFGKYLN